MATKTNNSAFLEKILSFIVIAFFLKVLYVIVQAISEGSFGVFFKGLLIAFVLLLVLYAIIKGLFGGSPRGSGSYSGGNSYGVDEERFNTIREKYEKLSEEFIEKKQYRKAAFVQLRLLKNPYKAAEILKDAKLYNDAAVLFLKRCSDKNEAANCYRLARNYRKAIDLYRDLEEFEIVGDIYTEKREPLKAKQYYKVVIDDYINNSQYVKASLIYRKKMNDIESAKELLLEGWRTNKDPENCLNNYFTHFTDNHKLIEEVQHINKTLVDTKNDYQFLSVMKHLYNKNEDLEKTLQEMAYSIIARHPKHTAYISMLKSFVKEDSQITKDIIKYRLKHNRK